MNRTVLATYVLIALLAPGAGATAAGTQSKARRVVLTLPRTPAAQEAVWLSVRLGVLQRGWRVLVLSDDGRLLGAISPFAIPAGNKAGTYTIPLPQDAVRHGRVAVRLAVEIMENVTRAPTRSEVEDVRLVYVPVNR